jgi:adenylate cyclase
MNNGARVTMEKEEHDAKAEEIWRKYLVTGDFTDEYRKRRIFRLLPGNPRCKNCYAPFQGIGAPIARIVFGKQPSIMNPRLCNICEDFAREHVGGSEFELSMLFADVRGSTTLAEGMSPTEFSQLINRFYKVSTDVLVQTDALIDKLTGDQVTGIYPPGFAGQDHARRALEAAQKILRATGHDDPDGPWIPLGAGVHTGIAFVGSVGTTEGMLDITVLGDAANTAARLASSARQGEILISEAAIASMGSDFDHLEKRVLELKGKSELVSVRVLTEYI